MMLKNGDREWLEIQSDDGTISRFMILGLDRGRFLISPHGDGDLFLKPDLASSVIVMQSYKGA